MTHESSAPATPPNEPAARSLVIKITSGVERAEACNQAFTVAAAAIAAGVDVSLWLTGGASWFALPGRAAELDVEHAVPLPDLLQIVLSAGRLTLCTQCAVRRDISEADLIDGVRIAGAPTFVEEVLQPGVQALIY